MSAGAEAGEGREGVLREMYLGAREIYMKVRFGERKDPSVKDGGADTFSKKWWVSADGNRTPDSFSNFSSEVFGELGNEVDQSSEWFAALQKSWEVAETGSDVLMLATTNEKRMMLANVLRSVTSAKENGRIPEKIQKEMVDLAARRLKKAGGPPKDFNF